MELTRQNTPGALHTNRTLIQLKVYTPYSTLERMRKKLQDMSRPMRLSSEYYMDELETYDDLKFLKTQRDRQKKKAFMNSLPLENSREIKQFDAGIDASEIIKQQKAEQKRIISESTYVLAQGPDSHYLMPKIPGLRKKTDVSRQRRSI